MRKVIFGLITTSLITAISTISFGTIGTVNTDNSRVRINASSDSTVLTLLTINEKVEIIEESGEWYKIKADGETGYISKRLLDVEEDVKKQESNTENTTIEQNETTSTEETKKQEDPNNNAETDKMTIIENFTGNLKSEVTIKILPSINSTNIAKIDRDTQIKVMEVINDWCKIETSLNSGWARISIVEAAVSTTNDNEQPEAIVEEKIEETTENKVGYVNVESVNLRKDKDTSSEVLDGITKNTEVTILSEEDGWYKVKVKDLTGYVSKKYISDKKVEEVTSRAADTARQIEESKQKVETETETEVEETTKQVASTGSRGTDVVSFAKQYLGSKYVSGGSSPSTGFDCSGFTSYVYSNFGVSLSRTSTAQANNGTSVSESNLEPGDLLIFKNSSNTSVGHVGIYIGNGQFIHAANKSKGVITSSLSSSYYEARYVDARRVLE